MKHHLTETHEHNFEIHNIEYCVILNKDLRGKDSRRIHTWGSHRRPSCAQTDSACSSLSYCTRPFGGSHRWDSLARRHGNHTDTRPSTWGPAHSRGEGGTHRYGNPKRPSGSRGGRSTHTRSRYSRRSPQPPGGNKSQTPGQQMKTVR